MTILNTYTALVPEFNFPNWGAILALVVFIGILFVGAAIKEGNGDAIPNILLAAAAFIAGFAILAFGLGKDEVTRYEALISPQVPFTQVYESYDIIEKRGDIWVLQDISENS